MKEENINNFNTGFRKTSIDLPYQVWVSAKSNLIEFKSALEFGIAFLLAEKDLIEYPQNSLSNKIKFLNQVIEDQRLKIQALENNKTIGTKTIEEDFKEVFGNGECN